MSNSSASANVVTLVGCRVAGPATYTPAYMPANGGKAIRQMASFNVYQNIGTKRSRFRITAWGKMADIVAKSCPQGKELTLICGVHSYRGKVTLPGQPGQPPQFVTDGTTGQPLEIEKIGFVIQNIHFGPDSEKQVLFEIQNNMRPAHWNVPGSQDALAWKQECERRNALQFNPQSNTYGYANVRMPNGQIIDPATINNANMNTQGGGGYTQQNTYGTAQPTPGFQGAQNTAAGQEVNVNGQNMGYALPQDNSGGQAGGYQPAPPAQNAGSSFTM